MRQTRAVVRQVEDELTAGEGASTPEIPLGAMIEVPSAALMARALAKEVDFFSLGTNDLVQYVLAADREDESIAAYYQPLHPAVLRLIHRGGGREERRPRAHHLRGDGWRPLYTELLLGLGLREFSVAPGEMLPAKDAIRAIRLEEARAVARERSGARLGRRDRGAADRAARGDGGCERGRPGGLGEPPLTRACS